MLLFQANEADTFKKGYFENLLSQKVKQAKRLVNYLKLPEKGLFASCKDAQLLAKPKKAHTDSGSVIAPAIAIIVKAMLGTYAIK